MTLATDMVSLPLFGRRVQISGSASAKTDPTLIAYAHDVVRGLVKSVMFAGGGIVAGLGREPRPDGAALATPSLLFDWTAIETAAECITSGFSAWPAKFGLPVVVTTSEKAESEIPEDRRALYDTLLKSGLLRVESIMPGSRAAAFLRQRQAAFGDALVILGGGTGVEHSASLYLQRHKPVVPLDLPLGASREDGTGGALRLSKEARSDPRVFSVSIPRSPMRKAQRSRALPRATAPCRPQIFHAGLPNCSVSLPAPLSFMCAF